MNEYFEDINNFDLFKNQNNFKKIIKYISILNFLINADFIKELDERLIALALYNKFLERTF